MLDIPITNILLEKILSQATTYTLSETRGTKRKKPINHGEMMSQASDVTDMGDAPHLRKDSLSTCCTESTVADTIEWQAERMTKDLLRLTASMKEYKDKLETIIKEHLTLTDKQKKANSKVLDSVNHALVHNRFDLRQTFSVLTIATVGARYAAAKEAMAAVEARLDTIEAQATPKQALRAAVMQLQRTEARLVFKQAVLQDPVDDAHNAFDVHDMVSSLLAGTQAGPGAAKKNAIKLRQVVVVPEDSQCIICSGNMDQAPVGEIEGVRACCPVLCPHCQQPMHIACQCAGIKRGKDICRNCREPWQRETMVETLTARINQLRVSERNWESANASKHFWGTDVSGARKRVRENSVKDENEDGEGDKKRLKV